MAKLSLIASALSLALVAVATPAMAGKTHYVRHHARIAAQAEPNLPVENALRWGYSQGYSNYPSGFGGLYGDGRYPGNTVSNSRYNTLH